MTHDPHRPDDLDRILGRLVSGGDEAPCPDAETIAAFADGALGSAARMSVVRHTAGCARCQAILAAVAKTDDLHALTPSAGLEGVPWWRRFLAPRWLVPLSAATTALVLWTARAPEVTTPGPPVVVTPSVPAQARREAETRAEPDVDMNQPSRLERPQTLPPATAGIDAKAAPVPRRQEARRDTGAVANAEPAVPPRLDDDPVASGFSRKSDPPSRSLPPPAPDTAKDGAPTVSAESAYSPPPPAAAQSGAGPLRSAIAQDARGRTANAVTMESRQGFEIPTPDPQRRWRWTGRDLEQSSDGGATWTSVVAAAVSALTAGSCPAVDVCWLVGRRGVVWRTTGGGSWESVTFPAEIDLAAVTGITANAAIVTAADGHRWATTDGGRTWSDASPAR